MIYVFLADGFEETEALTPVDLLRRAGIETVTVGITGKEVTGSHGITVKADTEAPVDITGAEMIILPGGKVGTDNLMSSAFVRESVEFCASEGIRIAAICAAPSVLGAAGVLRGLRATCFPGFENMLTGAELTSEPVVTDGLVTTAKSAGHSVSFGLELVRVLLGEEKAEKLRFAIMQQ